MILFQKQQKEIEEQRRKLEDEKEEFKRKTEAAMARMMRQTEEERKAMEAKMSGRIQELEAKMKQMKTDETPVVRNVRKYYQERLFKYIVDILRHINATYKRRRNLKSEKLQRQ